MNQNIEGILYSKPKFEFVYLEKIDLTQGDYTAKKLLHKVASGAEKIVEDNEKGKQYPFYIGHPLPLQMKVETWYGQTVIDWIFDPNKDSIPLKKIFADPAPVVVENGAATATEVTSIQVGY